MNRLMAIFLAAVVSFAVQARELGLIPMPAQLKESAGAFDARKARGIYYADDISSFNRSVLDSVWRGMSEPLTPVASGKKASVRLTTDTSLPREGYRLLVTPKEIRLTGGSNAGVYYGIMTLGQIMDSDRGASARGLLPCVEITDSPRYGFRALMVDPARHFLPVGDLKRFVDLMSRYKYNTLQLHLTDDQGWRVEIKSRPELAAGQKHYTQSELRDLVAYAADRNVEIIPEIDIPGHTAAFLHAHPELMCDTGDSVKIDLASTTNLMLCASRDSVYDIYDDIIAEIAALFPARNIHLGGDESAIAANWDRCSRDIALTDSLGLENPTQLMAYFFDRIFSSVRRRGKEPMMWCELDNIRMPARKYLFDYPKDVRLVTWRAGLTPKCMELTAASGHRLVMAPGEYAYLDYPQYRNDFPEFNNWGMPQTTLEQVYGFDPSYGGDNRNIDGVMGTLWAEAMPDVNRVTYMAFPRALALAEAGWSSMDRRDWNSFRRRLLPVLTTLLSSGVSFRVPFEIYPVR